jgi:hypothetical protein
MEIMLYKHISEEEITKKRTPFELWDWIILEVNQICSTNKGLRDFRLQKGLLKQLVEEITPLAKFGKHKYGDTGQVLLQPVIGNQDYDAIVTDLRTEPASEAFIEITQAHEGENDYWRRCELLYKGCVSSNAPVIKKNEGKKFTITIPNEATSVQGRLENTLNRIVDAAKRKASKDYPASTSLIIFFDDTPPFEKALKVIKHTTLDGFIKKEIMNLDLRFSHLYLVGETEQIFREYQICQG